MATFGGLISRIADKLIDDSLSSQIGTAINNAIVYYQQRRFWFNEASATITLNADDPVVPSIPSDFLFEIADGGLVIDYSNNRYPLQKITAGQYDGLNSQGRGLPYCYRNRAGNLELYFYPDQAYTLNLYYLKSYAALSDNADTNDWTNYGERLIEAKALADMWLDYRHEPEMSATFSAKAADEEAQLQQRNHERITTGYLVTENIID